MKVLLIGMDGAHLDVFSRGWTPFISSLIKNGTQLNIKNDLISRGWLEIATGQHASKTGAMYDKPKADGTLEWEPTFNMNDIPGLGVSIKPIWQALNEKGYRVGVMNLPTAFPAPKVNGFFVSGGGGGAPVTQTPSAKFCYPKEALEVLYKNDYVIDERFVQLVLERKITKPDNFFSRMENKNTKRTQSFIALANNYKIDFGFIIYKTSSVLAETMLPPEVKKLKNADASTDEALIKAVKAYYEKFDQEIKKLQESFPEAEIIFVSDHGMTTRTYSINPNILLQKSKYQSINKNNNFKKRLITKLKHSIPFTVKMMLKKSLVITSSTSFTHDFDPKNTLAFCHTVGDWVHGIYINDKSRFGGPVTNADIESIKEEIIEKFNNDSDAVKHQLHAYSIPNKTSKALKYFPDIVIDTPNGYVTSDQTKCFIERYTSLKSTSSISSIMRGDMQCIKSHTPLAISNGKTWKICAGNDENNLTAVYNTILKMFESYKV